MNTIILTDSGCDLPLSYVENNTDILEVLGMPVNIDGLDYLDDFGKSLSHEQFYNKLRSGIMPSTAQINVFRFMEMFQKHYELGNSIIYLGFSSAMSGTFNNAFSAKTDFLVQYPNADITVIDTVSASIGQGVLIVNVIEMIRNGKDKDYIIDWIEKNKNKTNHWFAVDDLIYLKKGGRVSAATAAVGTALNIKPILSVDIEGKLKTVTNVRGRKKSLKILAKKPFENTTNINDTIIIIGHGDCVNDANALAEMILIEGQPKQIIISELSATIASHVGPNMIAVAFVGDVR